MPKHTEGQHKQTPGAAMKGDGGDTAAATSEKKTDWQPMDTAPQDGAPVWLKFEGKNEAVECYWRNTRQFRKGAWQHIGFWTLYGQPPSRIEAQPTGWWREKKADVA